VKDLYARWAQVYDLFHPDRGDEVRFWDDLLGGAACQVLDLMCGTAEVSLALARLGHCVVGLDRSAAMLAVGKERLDAAADYPARNLSLVQGDACRLPVTRGRFEFILVGGNGSFNHLDRGQAGVALAEVVRALIPGGRLGMELINPFLLSEIDAERVLRPLRPVSPGRWVEMRVANRYDAAAGQFHIHQSVCYELAGDSGQWAESFVLQAWTPDQIRALLEGGGLGDIRFYGNYALEPFDRWSSDLLVVASRV
jgi:SAM-dependent methyltransferase